MAALLIEIDHHQRKVLKSLAQNGHNDRRIRKRVLIILLSADGKTRRNIAGLLKINPSVVTKWKKRFIAHGVRGLWDKPRSGRPRKYNKHTDNRILKLLGQQPPSGHSRWNRFLIAQQLGDVSAHQVWLVMKKNNLRYENRLGA